MKVETCHLCRCPIAQPTTIDCVCCLLLQDSWEDEEDEKKDEEKLDSAPVAKLKPKTKLQEKIAEKEVWYIRRNESLIQLIILANDLLFCPL